jgi:predicted transcriptional regulator
MAKKSENNKGNGKKEVKVNAFNHRIGTQAQKLDDLLVKGGLGLKELAKKVDSSTSRVQSHLSHLKGKGFTVNSEKIDEKMTYQLVAK